MPEYNPTQDFNTAYEAANRRLQSGFARRRGQLTNEIAAKGVSTSGVGTIPEEALSRGQAEAESDLIGQFAMNQAQTGIEDRRAADAFARQLQFQREGGNAQEAMQRRLARNQMIGQIGGGALGAIGGYFAQS